MRATPRARRQDAEGPDGRQMSTAARRPDRDREIDGLAQLLEDDQKRDDDAGERAAGDQAGGHHGAGAHVGLLGGELADPVDHRPDQAADEDRQGRRKGQVDPHRERQCRDAASCITTASTAPRITSPQGRSPFMMPSMIVAKSRGCGGLNFWIGAPEVE